MATKTVLRMTTATDVALAEHIRSGASDDEQFAFGVCSKAQGRSSTIYLLSETLLPGREDLAMQGPAGVGPTRAFQNAAYWLAVQQKRAILDMHSHPFQSIPRLSGIDDYQSKRNAQFVCENFPPEATMLMVVFNRDSSCFDGRVLDRASGKFRPLDRIEVLGKSIRIIRRTPEKPSTVDKKFSRHLLIPGWNQSALENLKVVLAGLGGNGAAIFSGLLSLGVGRKEGWIVACDPDVVERSNVPRIPYAFPFDVGKSKARVARRFARRKEPRATVFCHQGQIDDPSVLPWTKEAHVIIGGVDSDNARKTLNQLSANYLIPLLDVAAEIIPQATECHAAGQIRIVEPGANACLICSGGLDVSEVDPAELSEEQRAALRRAGYVRGLDETPTPAVLDLNGVASYLTLSHLRRMVFGESLAGRNYVLYDRQNCSLIAAAMPPPDPDCPVCGL
ncbi:ThiF family adenylyltransferase, partial [Candidatus Sumerlaeota bacterium]